MYPKMIYRDAVLSSNPANQRVVHSEDEELAAAADSFGAWDGKSKEAPAGVVADPASIEAQRAAFDAAASNTATDADEQAPQRRASVARGRNRQVD